MLHTKHKVKQGLTSSPSIGLLDERSLMKAKLWQSAIYMYVLNIALVKDRSCMFSSTGKKALCYVLATLCIGYTRMGMTSMLGLTIPNL